MPGGGAEHGPDIDSPTRALGVATLDGRLCDMCVVGEEIPNALADDPDAMKDSWRNIYGTWNLRKGVVISTPFYGPVIGHQ